MKYASSRAGAGIEHYAIQPAPRLPQGTLLKVPCIDCGAEVNVHCTSATGKVVAMGHRVRRRHAIRKYNEERTRD